MKNDGFTFRKRARSFKFAFNGIKLLITKEHNAWIHCFAAVCVLIAGVVFGLSRMEWIAVTIVIGAVLAAEAVNSSIEANERLGGGSCIIDGDSGSDRRVRHFYT